MKALSLRQPWAEAILLGLKTIEYRTRAVKFRGRVYLYASRGRIDPDLAAQWQREHRIEIDSLPRGVLVGTVEIVGCQPDERAGYYQWLLRNPERLTELKKPTRKPQPIWFNPF